MKRIILILLVCSLLLPAANAIEVKPVRTIKPMIGGGLLKSTPEPTPEPILEPTQAPFVFDAINRNPDNYEGQHFIITGRVVQAIEEKDDEHGYTVVGLRVATRGLYDDIIFVIYFREPGQDRILEDDRITFEGEAYGLYTYTSTDDVPITLPLFMLMDVIEIA